MKQTTNMKQTTTQEMIDRLTLVTGHIQLNIEDTIVDTGLVIFKPYIEDLINMRLLVEEFSYVAALNGKIAVTDW